MMDVTNGNTVAANVIPHGKHSAGDLRVASIPANTTATVKIPGGEEKEYVAGTYTVTK